jgi:hypothetical protein
MVSIWVMLCKVSSASCSALVKKLKLTSRWSSKSWTCTKRGKTPFKYEDRSLKITSKRCETIYSPKWNSLRATNQSILLPLFFATYQTDACILIIQRTIEQEKEWLSILSTTSKHLFWWSNSSYQVHKEWFARQVMMVKMDGAKRFYIFTMLVLTSALVARFACCCE